MEHNRVTGHLVCSRGKHGEVWRVRLNYGPDPLTKARRQPYDDQTFASEKAAQRRLADLLYELNRGPRLDPTRRTVGEVIAEWLDCEARLTVGSGTLEDYESTCRNHLLPAFGALPLRKLSTALIERWRAERQRAGTGTRTLELAMLHLSQAMKHAIRHSYIDHNPASALKPMRHAHREMQVWSIEEANRFLDHVAGHMYSPLWYLAVYTGMRKGELIGVQWGDIDLDGATMRVRRAISYAAGQLKEDDTKNRHARTIDLDSGTIRVLRDHRARQLDQKMRIRDLWGDRQWVCASTIGTLINPYNVSREVPKLMAAAGVPRIRFHDLRHTCASILLSRGVPVHVVSRQLGHQSVSITMNIYAHLMEGQGKAAAETMRVAMARDAR